MNLSFYLDIVLKIVLWIQHQRKLKISRIYNRFFKNRIKNWNCEYKNFDESLFQIYCSLETLTECMVSKLVVIFMKNLVLHWTWFENRESTTGYPRTFLLEIEKITPILHRLQMLNDLHFQTHWELTLLRKYMHF